jgi:hypothetical protein
MFSPSAFQPWNYSKAPHIHVGYENYPTYLPRCTSSASAFSRNTARYPIHINAVRQYVQVCDEQNQCK